MTRAQDKAWADQVRDTAYGQETPLALLIAGRIDQAEYRRRMADLERLAADSLDAEPAPLHRRPEPDHSGQVIVWLAVALAGVLLWIAIVGIVATIAAPRSAPDPTAPSAASDVAGLALASTVPAASSSGPRPSGAPHVRGTLDPGNGNQGGLSSEDSLSPIPRPGGAP